MDRGFEADDNEPWLKGKCSDAKACFSVRTAVDTGISVELNSGVETEQCLRWICFTALDPAAQKFFGFSEYLAALALMVLAWTTTDIRHRFRIATAPIPLHRVSFISIAAVGALALLTDLWRAEGWLVPSGNLLSPAIWQALLGAIFLLNFIVWAWFAYMAPPSYGKCNSHRFVSFLYHVVIDGSPADMTALGQELIRSVPDLIRHAPDLRRYNSHTSTSEIAKLPQVQGLAHDTLLLIADQRFCRVLVESSPGTILHIFQEISKERKYGVSIAQFGRNIVEAAIENKNSFLYHETDGYLTGLVGYLKPISQSIFSNYEMVEEIGALFDVNFDARGRWAAPQWEAYNRAVTITLSSYVATRFSSHSYVLSRALSAVEHSIDDLHKLDGSGDGAWDNDAYQRLRVAVDFCAVCLKILNEAGVDINIRLRVRKNDPFYYHSFFDHLAEMMLEIIFKAASIRTPRSISWTIQHNTVWREFFNQLSDAGPAGKILKFKLRRKIYDEIITAAEWPNYKNMKILAFSLNVMGLKIHDGNFGKDSRALHKAILSWSKKNFARIHEEARQIIEECLPAGLSYDSSKYRLIKTYEVDAFRKAPEYLYFYVDPL